MKRSSEACEKWLMHGDGVMKASRSRDASHSFGSCVFLL